MELTMEMVCWNCRRKARTGEPFISYETEKGMVYFCSDKCEEETRKECRQADNSAKQSKSERASLWKCKCGYFNASRYNVCQKCKEVAEGEKNG